MGKIVGSWALKVHEHLTDLGEELAKDVPGDGSIESPTNDQVKECIVGALEREFGGQFTVSEIDKVDE